MMSLLAAEDHCTQAFGHDQRKRNMYNDKRDNCDHRKEMHVSRGLIAAEDHRQFLQLDRLPNRQTRQDGHRAGKDNAHIEQLLH